MDKTQKLQNIAKSKEEDFNNMEILEIFRNNVLKNLSCS